MIIIRNDYHQSRCVPKMSSSLVSVLPPMFPAFAQNLEICLVPESQRIVTILWPGPSLSAVLNAAIPFLSQFL